MAGAASQAGDTDSSGALGVTSGLQGSVNVPCFIVGATVTVYQFFYILHFCHTCFLCRVELVVQFPAKVSTQVLLCLIPGVLWLWHFLNSVGPHLVSIHFRCVAGIHVRLAKQETLTPLGHLVTPLVFRVRIYPPWCSLVGATVTVHQIFCILLYLWYIKKQTIRCREAITPRRPQIKQITCLITEFWRFLTEFWRFP